MADPVTATVATVASIASSAFGAASAISAGQAEGQAYERDAQAAEMQARVAALQGKQAGADIERQWADTFSAMSAIRASRGLSPDSPTARALERGLAQDARRTRARAILGFTLDESAAYFRARSSRLAGRTARRQGYLEAAPHLFDLAAQTRRLSGGGGGGSTPTPRLKPGRGGY